MILCVQMDDDAAGGDAGFDEDFDEDQAGADTAESRLRGNSLSTVP